MSALSTRYGLFEYYIMPLGLANAPSTFQNSMSLQSSVCMQVGLTRILPPSSVTSALHNRMSFREIMELREPPIPMCPHGPTSMLYGICRIIHSGTCLEQLLPQEKPFEEMSWLRKLEMDRRAAAPTNKLREDFTYEFDPRMRVAVKSFNEAGIWKQKITSQSILGSI